jgi:hypothetical protein
MSPGRFRALVLVSAVVALGSLPWLASYLLRDVPTSQQACTQKCASLHKDGHLVYRGPATPKDAQECQQ